MIKIQTKWYTWHNYYKLIGWSEHRRIAKGEIVAMYKPDGDVIYGRAVRTKYNHDCDHCMLWAQRYTDGKQCCPVDRNGKPFCERCGHRATAKFKFIEVDFDPILDGL